MHRFIRGDDAPTTGKEIFLAANEGYAVVLVTSDGSKLILHPQPVGAVRDLTS
jgi:hypothetical protein